MSVSLVLSQYLWSQTGVTGQCKINRTDIQPCSIWGWVTVFKLQLGAKHTVRNLNNKHIPSRHLRIPKRTHLPSSPPAQTALWDNVLPLALNFSRPGFPSSCSHSPAWRTALVKLQTFSLTQCHHLDNRVHNNSKDETGVKWGLCKAFCTQ